MRSQTSDLRADAAAVARAVIKETGQKRKRQKRERERSKTDVRSKIARRCGVKHILKSKC